MKVKATQIIFQRVEGEQRDRFWVTDMSGADIWFKANTHISRYARTAPVGGKGYDKCDFAVLFEDGNVYAGRFDLQKEHVQNLHSLDNHIHSVLTWMSANEQGSPLGKLANEWLMNYAISV